MYAKSKETIQTILDSARMLFIEKNYADVTISDIVSQANVSKGALYHHFSGKEDVYLRMMHHFLGEIQTHTQAVVETSSGACRERLKLSTKSFLQLPEELLGVLRLVRRDINIFADPLRADLVHAYQRAVPEQVEAIIRDGINSGELQEIDARLLSWQLVALVEVTLRPYSRRILGNTQQMSDFVITMFFDGISAWSSKQTVDSKN
jgi:AcrR family transcriptional regulator